MNNDLISRQALRNVILKDRKLDGANANWEVNRILVHIDNAPTAEPEITASCYIITQTGQRVEFEIKRPQGEWIKDEEHSITIEMFKCSICGCWGGANHFNFCPNCGADMRGEKE